MNNRFIKVANETICRPTRALTEARGYAASKHTCIFLSQFLRCAYKETLQPRKFQWSRRPTRLRNRKSHWDQNDPHPPIQLHSLRVWIGPCRPVRPSFSPPPYLTSNSPLSLFVSCSTFYTPQNKPTLLTRLDRMTADVRSDLREQGFEEHMVHVERMLNMRFEGTDTALMVLPHAEDGNGDEDFESAFKRVYKAEFGFLLEKSVIVDDIEVIVFSSSVSTHKVDDARF